MKPSRFGQRRCPVLLPGFLLLSLALGLPAATFIWGGGGLNNNFTTVSNWVGNSASAFNYAPSATADSLVFAGTNRLLPSNDTASGETNGQTAFTLTFAGDAGAFVIGGNKITLGSTTGNGGSGGSISNLSAQTQTLNCEVAPRSGVILAQGGNLVFDGRFNIGNGATTRTNIFDGGFDVVLNGQATSKGVVVKRGTGQLLLLNPTNDFIGPMTIAQGVVSLGPSGSISNCPSIYLASSGRLDVAQFTRGFALLTNQVLAGDGVVTGAVEVAVGATLAPGSSVAIGALIVNGSLVLRGDTLVRWRKTGTALTNDSVRGISSLTCSGGLVLTNLGTTVLAAGDTLRLFAATSGSGIFASITPPVPGPGLVWDLSELSTFRNAEGRDRSGNLQRCGPAGGERRLDSDRTDQPAIRAAERDELDAAIVAVADADRRRA